jgi:hypothetical protein
MPADIYAAYTALPSGSGRATGTHRPGKIVRAAQLTHDNTDDILWWTNGYRLGPDRWIPQEGCWRVSAQRWYPPHNVPGGPAQFVRWLHRCGALLVGIRTRDGEQVAYENDWLVQGEGGAFTIVRPRQFIQLYRRNDHA